MAIKSDIFSKVLKYIPLLIIVSFLFVFSGYVIKVWEKSFFYTLFASVESGSLLIDLILLATLFFFMAYYIYEYRKALYHPDKMYVYSLAILILYVFYRYSICSDWKYVSFSLFPFKYLDIFYIPFITSVIIALRIYSNCLKDKETTKKTSKEQSTVEQQSGFINDIPSKLDDYKRGKYAEILSQKLMVTDCREAAFTLGIIGKWGAGKTTFMDLIKNNIKKHIIEFKPWLCSDENELINEYFSKLKSAASIYEPTIKSQIDSYIKSLMDSAGSSFVHTMKSFMFPFENKTTHFQYEEIKEVFKKIEKRFFIFIDDFDRLNAKEICAVLQIIRNTSNFPYLTFIVAYDKDYVTNTLESTIYEPDKYLEKIFNMEIVLPTLDKDLLIRKLLEYISTLILPMEKYPEQIDSLNQFFYSSRFNDNVKLFTNIFRDLRGVKRFCNSFNQNISTLLKVGCINDFDIISLFILELLRYKSLGTYNILRDNPELILTREIEHYILKVKSQKTIQEVEDMKQTIDKANTSKYDEIIITNSQRLKKEKLKYEEDISFQLLELLFQNSGNKGGHISHIACYDIYFSYGIASDIIRYEDFNDAVMNEISTIGIFTQWIKDNKMLSLRYHCGQLLFSEKFSVKNKLHAICSFTEILIKKSYYDAKNIADQITYQYLSGFLSNNATYFYIGDQKQRIADSLEFFESSGMELSKIYLLSSMFHNTEPSQRENIARIISKHIVNCLNESRKTLVISDAVVMVCYASHIVEKWFSDCPEKMPEDFETMIQNIILENPEPWIIKSFFRNTQKTDEIILDRYFLTAVFGTHQRFSKFLEIALKERDSDLLHNYDDFVNQTYIAEDIYSVPAFPGLNIEKVETKYLQPGFCPFPRDKSFNIQFENKENI